MDIKVIAFDADDTLWVNEPYFQNTEKEKDKLERYSMDEDFLIKFEDFGKDIFSNPKNGTYIETIDYTLPQQSRNELAKILNGFRNKAGIEKSFIKKVKEFFANA